ncbi:MAG: hypothetical protein SF028_11815 [Candidatus Sumerlaeia bacterium]|nr:hypothetical protein [Candidatus Sumerlaeia bacterium]
MGGNTPGWVGVAAALSLGVFLFFLVREEGPGPRVSPIRSNMRSIATALESYAADHGSYPPMTPYRRQFPAGYAPRDLGHERLTTVGGPRGEPWSALVGPRNHLLVRFADPFASEESEKDRPSFAYVADDSGWLLISPGPDRRFESVDYGDLLAGRLNGDAGFRALVPYTFDPTNGAPSAGDVFRLRQ